MKISSEAFNEGETIPVRFTCEGPNVSPPLKFEGAPERAKSLVLMVEDPDADAKPWVHWLVYNIPPATKEFHENSIAPGAVQGYCNGNTLGYEGPCPPENEHTYLFKIYAIDKTLDDTVKQDRKKVLNEIEGHVVEEAVLKGKYKKRKS